MVGRRVAALRRRLRAGEARLIVGASDLRALTGAPIEGCWLLVRRDETVVLASRMTASAVRAALPGVQVCDGERILPLLLEHRGSVRTLRVDDGIPWSLYRALRRHFTVIPDGETGRLRMVKTPAEISSLREACRVCTRVVRRAARMLRPGITERAVAFDIATAYFRYGAVESFPTIVAFDANTAFPHHIPGETRYRPGGIAMIDTGCRIDGMCSDITRMYGTREHAEIHRVERVIRDLQRELVSLCRPGVAVAAIDRRAREVCRDRGMLHRYLHTTGHGIGLEIHEAPRVSVADRTVLEPGMTITVEPGVYFDGAFGIRIEDTVLVTRGRPEVLTAG